jgi:beta-lactamase class A
LFVGGVIGYASHALTHPLGSSLYSRVFASGEVHAGGSQFTNPLLQCEFGEEFIAKNAIRPFRDVMTTEIGRLKSEGKIHTAGVYFRDLNNGTWFEVNGLEPFLSASLLKVPLLIEILKKVEYDPHFFSQQVEYIGVGGTNLGIEQYFKSNDPIKAGSTYTVQGLIEHTIKNSDNDAAAVLAKLLGEKNLYAIYREIGVTSPPEDPDKDYMIPREYASFFRILFNASYLSREYSEAALSLLSQTTFIQGIVAGVPSDITVSHKFGERFLNTTSEKQLHDCGIVNYPQRPYLLCVMMRGDDFEKLADAIRGISRITYQNVDIQMTTR